MNILFFLIIILGYSFNKEQTIHVKYLHKIKINIEGSMSPDITNALKKSIEKGGTNLSNSASNGLEHRSEYELIHSNGRSYFKQLTQTGKSAIIEYCKDFGVDTLYMKKKFIKEKKTPEIIKEAMTKSDWKIDLSKSKKILNYKVFCATKIDARGQPTEAWFTKEIPIPDGPYNDFGLPGLILEVNKGTASITATQVDILPKNTELKRLTLD